MIGNILGVKRGWVENEDILSKTTPKMDGKRIISIACPRDPAEHAAFNADEVTAEALNALRKYLLDEVLKRRSDNVMIGRLKMNDFRISGLGSPVNSDHDVKMNKLQRGCRLTDKPKCVIDRTNKFKK